MNEAVTNEAYSQSCKSDQTEFLEFTPKDLENFEQLLLKKQAEVIAEANQLIASENIKADINEMKDDADYANYTLGQNLTFKMLDRLRKLNREIAHALKKIPAGEFGYCEGTGEPIPRKRLLINPWVKYSVEYKSQLEKAKKKKGRGFQDE
ncbi:MAG: TraR/DksA family transcriptional regulator [Oligoflexales bacterium]|nr:TraR/DksA family transcriptional regulator [Oligoflexales bacterium]